MKRILIVMLVLCMLGGVSLASTLKLPSNLKTIDNESFYNDTSLDKVILPEAIETIKSRAFANSSVKQIYLPQNLRWIYPDAFDGTSGIVGYGPDGTYAASYFSSNKLTYVNEKWFATPTTVECAGVYDSEKGQIIPQSQYGKLLNLKGGPGWWKLYAPSDGYYTFEAWNTSTDTEADIWLMATVPLIEMVFPKKSASPISFNTDIYPAGQEVRFWLPANGKGNLCFTSGLKTVITFHEKALPVTKVTSITIDNTDNYQFAYGTTRQLTATITPSNATNKKIRWVKDSGSDGININETTGLVTAATSGRIKVHAEALDGSGIVSDSFFLYCIPNQIPTLKVDRVGGSRINLSWNRVPGASGYRVRYKPASTDDDDWEGMILYGEWNNTCELKGLLSKNLNPKKDTVYDVKILAFSYDGNKTKSSTEFSAVTKVNLLTKDDLGLPTVSIKTKTANTVTLNLSAGKNSEYFYIDYYGNKVNGDWQIEDELGEIPANVGTYTITGLTPNTKIYIDVYPETWDETVYYSASDSYRSVTVTTNAGANAPAAPSNLKATSSEVDTINLSWTASSNADGYYIRKSSANASPIQVTGRNTTSYPITGLKANTTYNFYVSAYSTSNGESERIKVEGTTSNVILGQVTGVKQTAYTKNSISLTWNALANATSYKVWWRPTTAGSGAWSSKTVGANPCSCIIDSGLNADNSYEVCVVGFKGTACGMQSESVEMRTYSKNISVERVTLDVTSSTLTLGGNSLWLKETVFPTDATNQAVTWASTNSSVATVSNGVVKPVSVGTTTITVKTADGGKSATCDVRVVSNIVPVEYIKLNKSLMELTVGETDTLIATVYPTDASNKKVTWNSSDSSVVTVSNGLVTAKKAGTATVTASAEDGGNTKSCNVTVTQVAPVFTVSHSSLSGTVLTLSEDAGDNNYSNLKIKSNKAWTAELSDSTFVKFDNEYSTATVSSTTQASGAANKELNLRLKIVSKADPGTTKKADLTFTVDGEKKVYTVTQTVPRRDQKPMLSVTVNTSGALNNKEYGPYSETINENTGISVQAGSSVALWPGVTFSKGADTLVVDLYNDGEHPVETINYSNWENGSKTATTGSYSVNNPDQGASNPYVPCFYFPENMEAGTYWLTAIATNSAGTTKVKIAVNVTNKPEPVIIPPSATLSAKFTTLKNKLNGKYWSWGSDSVPSYTETISYGDVSVETHLCSQSVCSHTSGLTKTCQAFGFDGGKPACKQGPSSTWGSKQCAGYARLIGWAITGKDPYRNGPTTKANSTNRATLVANLEPGDIIRVGTVYVAQKDKNGNVITDENGEPIMVDSGSGRHSMVVIDTDNTYIYVTEGNYDYKCGISWSGKKTRTELSTDDNRNELYHVYKYKNYK